MILGEIKSQIIVTPDQPWPNTAPQRMNTEPTRIWPRYHHGSFMKLTDYDRLSRTIPDPTRIWPRNGQISARAVGWTGAWAWLGFLWHAVLTMAHWAVVYTNLTTCPSNTGMDRIIVFFVCDCTVWIMIWAFFMWTFEGKIFKVWRKNVLYHLMTKST